MPYYIFGNNVTQPTKPFAQVKRIPALPPSEIVDYIINVALREGIQPSEVSYRVSTTPDEARIDAGDEYNLIWSSGQIVDLDFTPEDTKRWVDIQLSTIRVPADGTTPLTVTITLYSPNPDGTPSGNVFIFNGTRYLPVATSHYGIVLVEFTFVNGVATKQIIQTLPGHYVFPAALRYNGNRVIQQKEMDFYI